LIAENVIVSPYISSAMDITFNHVGIAVADLAGALPIYQEIFGYLLMSGPFDDPIQNVSVCFLRDEPGGPVIELVAPFGENSPIQKILKAGGGAYHLCYEAKDLDSMLLELSAKGCVTVSEPVPAVAFGGRRIAWLFTPVRQLLELVERGDDRSRG
jgi:methylmalonyl-CoA/ethylmalonyl-CoA epimerase